MSTEEKELLRRSVAIGEDNNDILRGMQRSMRFSRFMSILYWIIIIGSAVGAYYFVQPYWDEGMKIYNDAKVQFTDTSGFINGIKAKMAK